MTYISKKSKVNSLVIMALFILIAASPLQAQWSAGGFFNISNTNTSVNPEPNSADYSSRFGLGIGAVVDRTITGQLSLRGEPMFVQKGTNIDLSGDDVNLKFSYFELPVMVQYNFQTAGPLVPYAMAGPSLGFLLNAKAKLENGDKVDSKDQFKGTDFGLGFGGGASIPRGGLTLFAEARYLLGLSNINAEDDVITVKNRGLKILVGAAIPLSLRRE